MYTTSWTPPGATGAYTVMLGVFNSNWSTNYAWNSNAATITVANSDTAEYNFESGTQGWVASGGMITGVSSSTAEVFAGTHALAVTFNGSGADTQEVSISAPSTPAGRSPITSGFHQAAISRPSSPSCSRERAETGPGPATTRAHPA